MLTHKNVLYIFINAALAKTLHFALERMAAPARALAFGNAVHHHIVHLRRCHLRLGFSIKTQVNAHDAVAPLGNRVIDIWVIQQLVAIAFAHRQLFTVGRTIRSITGGGGL